MLCSDCDEEERKGRLVIRVGVGRREKGSRRDREGEEEEEEKKIIWCSKKREREANEK